MDYTSEVENMVCIAKVPRNGPSPIPQEGKWVQAKMKLSDINFYNIVKNVQPICFENACWPYIVGAAIAIKKDQKIASDIAETLGEGLQAFCIPGSVADDRRVGIGHGNLASMLLGEETKCFAFLHFLQAMNPLLLQRGHWPCKISK
jgi:hypothetical protein